MATSTVDEPKLPGGYLVTPRVPQGLAAAVEGLTREVIRHSPEDIYVFAAHHFEKLLHLREQCGGVEKVSERDSNLRALREMSQALKMREMDRGNVRLTRNTVDQVGWSLNQTAKVLKRHRSIFGDTGQRISTDEVFRMANQKENQKSSTKMPAEKSGSRGHHLKKHRSSEENADNLWKASTSRTERSWSNDDSADTNEINSETRSGPRIITRIPSLQSSGGLLAKDIKTELRKNRISSRERRSVKAKPENRNAIDKNEGRPGKQTGKSLSSRKRLESEIEQKQSNRNNDSKRSPTEGQDRKSDHENSSRSNGVKSEYRALSMDRVTDYVVQRFATTKSLEELQSVNYVEKVQEIIDETGSIIKEKVDELKSGMIGRSKRSSWFEDSRNNRAQVYNDSPSNRRSDELASSKDSPASRGSRGPINDELKSRLTETQNLLENVSSSLTKPLRRSRSARSSRRSKSGTLIRDNLSNFEDPRDEITTILDPSNRASGLETRLSKTRNLLEDISSTLSRPMRRSCSAKSLRRYDDGTTDDSSDVGMKGDALKTRLDETRNLLEGLSATLGMPGHRIRSAKSTRHRANHSANLSNEELSNSDSQSLSKVSLPAVKSISLKSSPGSVSRSDLDNLVLPAISPEAPKSAKIKEDLILPILSPPGTGSSNGDTKIVEATDVLFDEFDIPEIPVEDYIPETLVDDVFRDSLNVTPNFDSIPQRPDSLEPEETSEVIEDGVSKTDDLESKLQEIQKVEKNIEEIFESQTLDNPESPSSAKDSNIKKKLQELEEAEKRIDRIFNNEVCNGSKDSPASENDTDVPVEVVDEFGEFGRTLDDGTKIIRAIPNVISQNESNVNNQTAFKGDDRKNDQLSVVTPESLNYTYVLTEGSPYDIPDTVTTVIIPERTVESPESSPVDDGLEQKLSLLPENTTRKESLEGIESSVENLIETDNASKDTPEEKLSAHLQSARSAVSIKEIEAVEDLVKSDSVDDTKTVNSSEAIVTSPKDLEKVAEKPTKSHQASPKMNESDKDDITLNIQSDIFGEYVKPEITELTSLDFIRGMENRHDIHISHQDLCRINEELSEELESLEERNAGVKRSMKVETIDESKEETLEGVIESKESTKESKTSMMEEVSEDKQVNEENEGGNKEEDDKTKERTESELSPLATRPGLDSESSNEAKESSAADEPLESAKCGVSLEEEVSSETRSPESSNEVKETTLTDGLSLSLDPTRPYVPELNLDSLQDITVSSFKMTEDDYDIQGKAESENTNSITETLTSDENHRIIIDNVDFAGEAIMEYIVSSSDRSKVEETHEDLEHGEEVVEEPIVKNQVEIKEDICEKISTYVTGPSNEEKKGAEDVTKSSEFEQVPQEEQQAVLCEIEEEIQMEETENKVVNDEAKFSEVEEVPQSGDKKEEDQEKQDLQIPPASQNPETVITKNTKEGTVSEEKEKNSLESESSTEAKASENVMKEVTHKSLSEDEKEEKQDLQISPTKEQITTVDSQNLKEETVSEEKANVSVESQHSDEAKASKDAIIEDLNSKSVSEAEQKEGVDSPISVERNYKEVEDTKEDKHEKVPNVVKSQNVEVQEKEDIIDKNRTSEEAAIAEEESTEESNKSVDLESMLRSGDDGSDEILEESFVEEDTPLAASRSASQCTTRRVSSGNLARLREDPSLSWTEEVGPEGSGEEDPVPSAKIKFSKIGGETIKEQGSDEIDQSPDTDTPKNAGNEIDENTPKDSKEYHIYVPDVDAGEDNSTTDSSTVESAVTKIQARVRGFLTRRRLHRGQHNRSSTLGSIPSIQDSIAVDPEKEESQEKTGISSLTASEDPGLENAATRIQSNYRRYKMRNRLRREDAVQRTTLSLEKSFAESGLQHTGEFHDCVPLPIHDLSFEKRSSIATRNIKSLSTSQTITSPSGTDKTSSSDSSSNNSDKIAEDVSSPKVRKRIYGHVNDSNKNVHDKAENPLENENLGQTFFGQSSNVPIIQFGMNQNISQLVDLVVLAKEEAALQSGYLNFITSVEDNDGVDEGSAVTMNAKGFSEVENNSDSFKEPLALSVTPLGVVIEEITSSGAENFMKSDDLDPTIASTESSVAPEDVKNESSKVVAKIVEHRESPGDELNVVEANQMDSSSEKKIVENLVLPAESTIEDFTVPDSFSLSNEKGLLGPESSVDSMECPVAANEDKNSSRCSTEVTGKSAMPKVVEVHEAVEEKNPEDKESNADESSSMLTFSMKAQDFLGLGSEDSMELHGRKPILEVTLTPADLMKSKSISQESQLAGERIESPITMVQMAPGRSESLQQEDLSENGCEDDETNGERTLGESSTKSENKNVVT